jgi:hypothetical protein
MAGNFSQVALYNSLGDCCIQQYENWYYVIYEQRERVLYPGETRARVVYMASQTNRDEIECFRLLI